MTLIDDIRGLDYMKSIDLRPLPDEEFIIGRKDLAVLMYARTLLGLLVQEHENLLGLAKEVLWAEENGATRIAHDLVTVDFVPQVLENIRRAVREIGGEVQP